MLRTLVQLFTFQGLLPAGKPILSLFLFALLLLLLLLFVW